MCEMCEEGHKKGFGMASCQDCCILICFDIENGDDVIARAYVTASGDLFCRRCGSWYDEQEEQEADESGWDDYPGPDIEFDADIVEDQDPYITPDDKQSNPIQEQE